jgi:superkiller protein 3
LVRLESASALDSCALEPQVAQALRRHLSDPIRAVRVAAAWACKSSVETSSVAGLDLSRYMDCNADQPSGQMQLGAFFFARGQPEAAVQHYQKAVAWDPNSAVSRHDYAIVLSSLGRAEEAIAELAAACRLEPTNAGFRFELGLGFNEAGQAGRAIECLRAAVKLDPSFAKAWYNLGLALSSEGKTEEALDALVRSEAADPRDPRPPYARASILARLGALEQARKAAAKALSIDPGFTPAAQLLESLR